MTKLLLRMFVKNYEKKDDPRVRGEVGRLSGLVGIGCNLLLFLTKLLVGLATGSMSITADAMNNLSDASSSIVTLLGFKLAEKPADEDHPFGHARFEYLSGLAVAAMIVVIGFELAKTSVEKIFHPEPVVFTLPAVLVLVCSIGVKLWLSLFNTRLGRHIGSGTLMATAADSRNDCISTGAVLLAGGIEYLTHWRIDSWMGLGVALFILYSGASLAKETISPLLGEAASPELVDRIVETVRGDPKVLGFHDLMVHDYGPGQRFASIHVEMDERESPMECHERIDNLERECLEKLGVHLVIHYDPVTTGDEALETIRTTVQKLLAQQDSRLTIHDFRMVRGNGHTNLIFDMAVPSELMGRAREIKQTLDRDLAAQEPGTYYTVVTFDMAEFNR